MNRELEIIRSRLEDWRSELEEFLELVDLMIERREIEEGEDNAK